MSIDFDSLLEGVNKKDMRAWEEALCKVLCRVVFLREQYLAGSGSGSGHCTGCFGGYLEIFQAVWGYEGTDFLFISFLL